VYPERLTQAILGFAPRGRIRDSQVCQEQTWAATAALENHMEVVNPNGFPVVLSNWGILRETFPIRQPKNPRLDGEGFLIGAPGEINSGHPWPSPRWGRIRDSKRLSCRFVELGSIA